MMITCSKEEARKKLLQYHNLDGSDNLSGVDGIRTIMKRIGSVQYDPLNVVGRNADLVLQARVREYKQEYLHALLYEEHCLVDGLDKEMCIYNTEDFGRFSRVREENVKQIINTLRHRGQLGALDILEDVIAFITENGITGTKDISIGEVRESRWGHKKLSSAALDYLYNRGDLCVADKRGTQKVFDLTERVLPAESYDCCTDMSMDEFLEWYIERRIKSVGFIWNKNGGAWQGNFVRENDLRTSVLHRLSEQGRLKTFKVEGIEQEFYACKELMTVPKEKEQEDYARFIAPLDNIMWDRTMLESIFDFSYRWEVYTPVVKRKYGYYVIPVIYNDKFVARFEPEYVSKAGMLQIKNWWWEAGINSDNHMREVITKELFHFAEYLNTTCDERSFRVMK